MGLLDDKNAKSANIIKNIIDSQPTKIKQAGALAARSPTFNNAIGLLSSPIEQLKSYLGDYVIDKTNSPLLATAAYMTPEVALAIPDKAAQGAKFLGKEGLRMVDNAMMGKSGLLGNALTGIKPLGVSPMGIASKTPYELAHEVAQKNAVDMLGLPSGNTAMDRAKALGFSDKTYYHGTNADIKAFDPEMSAQGGITWIAENPKYANDYTMNVSQGSGNIIPLKANMGKTAGWKEYDQLGLDELSGRGYKSTWLPEKDGESVGFVMNPNQLRSINAAFDPARAHESDLLGSINPEILPYLLGGGLLSAGGVNYLNKDNKK